MEIFVAHSSRVEPEGSWILRQLTDYHDRGIDPVFDLGGDGDPVSDDLLARSNAIVAEFGQPNAELAHQVSMAYQMGKNALAFMPANSSLAAHLPDFADHAFEGNNNGCDVHEMRGGPTLSAYRGGMRAMKLKLWVGAQLTQERLRNLSAAERRKIADDWEAEAAAENPGGTRS